MDKERRFSKPVLIYDQDCLICRKAVQWVDDRSGGKVFEMLPYQSKEVEIRFPSMERSAPLKAMQFILPEGRVLSGEKAIPEIMGRLRGYRWVPWLFRIPGSEVVSRAIYRWFASHRYRIAHIVRFRRRATRE
jgi:predicted DCC family thiol-disulfide oxidoreductase YuxK